MLHQVIETLNARVALRPRYDNFIGGKWVAPVDGKYFDNISPITGKPVCQIARSQAADIELALDAAHEAKDAWGKTAPAKRAEILNKIADRMEENLEAAGGGRDHRQRQADPRDAPSPTSRSPSTISAISPPASARRKARCRRSITTPSPITFTSRWAWSARSSRGTSRS